MLITRSGEDVSVGDSTISGRPPEVLGGSLKDGRIAVVTDQELITGPAQQTPNPISDVIMVNVQMALPRWRLTDGTDAPLKGEEGIVLIGTQAPLGIQIEPTCVRNLRLRHSDSRPSLYLFIYSKLISAVQHIVTTVAFFTLQSEYHV